VHDLVQVGIEDVDDLIVDLDALHKDKENDIKKLTCS
jgi:hypothetical protein